MKFHNQNFGGWGLADLFQKFLSNIKVHSPDGRSSRGLVKAYRHLARGYGHFSWNRAYYVHLTPDGVASQSVCQADGLRLDFLVRENLIPEFPHGQYRSSRSFPRWSALTIEKSSRFGLEILSAVGIPFTYSLKFRNEIVLL